MTKTHEMIPGARRLIGSLRDLGYDFASAVADIVDNSISAHAKTVSINVHFAGDDSWVCVADDGDGMSPAALREAMRYGADRSYESDELGKFGLGLKTASMSQCQRLIVATRSGQSRARVTAYCWDLSHIAKTNRWEITAVDTKTFKPDLALTLRAGTGTVVLWQRLDRILAYQYGKSAKNRIAGMCRELEQHLAMVFHRFLAGEVRGKTLTILLNGNPIRPWDPYARDEPRTVALEQQSIEIENGATSGPVTISPYVLPAQALFSTPAAFNASAGPSKWNRQQGLYIYRADRLIQSGGWSGLRTLDEHTKLARIAVSFGTDLDEAFKINVAKMKVQLPPALRIALMESLAPVIKRANKTYRENSKSGEGETQRPNADQALLPKPLPSNSREPRIKPTTTFDINKSVKFEATQHNAIETRKINGIEIAQLEAAFKIIADNATPEEAKVLRPLVDRIKRQAGLQQHLNIEQDSDNVNFA
ncbi:ATP-binding protein [Burkholderia ambifaria]|uniref:ATP-binding protein n=1 Tax=Burkholderia ambifaria TaxID=152480 RepID=UPI00158B1B90|nr:ATP-binding protein [Burkholderia ambifaria]